MGTRRERAKAPNILMNKQLEAINIANQLRRFESQLCLWKSTIFRDIAKFIIFFLWTDKKEKNEFRQF